MVISLSPAATALAVVAACRARGRSGPLTGRSKDAAMHPLAYPATTGARLGTSTALRVTATRVSIPAMKTSCPTSTPRLKNRRARGGRGGWRGRTVTAADSERLPLEQEVQDLLEARRRVYADMLLHTPPGLRDEV